MNAVTSPPNSFRIAVLAVCCLGGAGTVSAQSLPDSENGRYTLSPAGDGAVIRLDTRTGTVSNCNNSGAGWACYAVPDERSAMDAEIGRLQAENEKLKARVGSRDSTVEGKIDEPLPKDALPKSDKQGPPKVAEGERRIEIPLPSDQDMDRVMSFVERAWRRLVEIANRIQKDAAGKI
jgi:hypothetical protein